MREIVFVVVENVSFLTGLIAIAFIFLGVFKALYHYVVCREHRFLHIRTELGRHMILGLDFLIAKDIIDTFLLPATGKTSFDDLLRLITVVGVRIILTYFLEKELESLKRQEEGVLKKLKIRH